MITPNEALHRCIEHREIFHDEMLHLMRMLMRGEMSPAIAAALLMGLRVKKETVGEITAAAQVMREFATPVHATAVARSISQRPRCLLRLRPAYRLPNTVGAARRPRRAVQMCLKP